MSKQSSMKARFGAERLRLEHAATADNELFKYAETFNDVIGKLQPADYGCVYRWFRDHPGAFRRDTKRWPDGDYRLLADDTYNYCYDEPPGPLWRKHEVALSYDELSTSGGVEWHRQIGGVLNYEGKNREGFIAFGISVREIQSKDSASPKTQTHIAQFGSVLSRVAASFRTRIDAEIHEHIIIGNELGEPGSKHPRLERAASEITRSLATAAAEARRRQGGA